MKAVVLVGFGPADQALQYRTDHPRPVRKPGEVLIAVQASSVNPGEWKVRQGLLPKGMIKIPQIQGVDVAGVVEEADAGGKFKVGDRVFGNTGQILSDPWGTYAEYVCARQEMLCPMPPGLGWEAAAALPLAGMTAWQALAPSMPLAGRRVLVHAAAGGVGHIAVQIAKAQGAYVAATCSSRNVEFVTGQLGADLAIDYTQGPFEAAAAAAGPFDLVVDLVGAEPRSWGLLARGGRMAAVSWDTLVEGKRGMSVMLTIMARIMRLKLLSALRLMPRYDGVMQQEGADKGLQQLCELVAAGKVAPHVDAVFPLTDLAAAHRRAEAGGARGKIAIRVAAA